MSEQAENRDVAPATRKTNMVAGGQVQAIVPQNIDEMARFAQIIVKSGMAPKGIDTPEKAMICLLSGQEVGFTPMMSLQSIAPINGRPTIWGDGALGLIQGSGKMEWIKEWIDGEGDERSGHCEVKRKGDEVVKSNSFSVAQAKKAGLWGKAGPWTSYPDRMLISRPRSWSLRDGFSDVLKGIGIREEVEDYTDLSATSPAQVAKPSVPRASEMEPTAPVPAAPQATEAHPDAHEAAFVPAQTEDAPVAVPTVPTPPADATRVPHPTNAVFLKEMMKEVRSKDEPSSGKTRYGIFTSTQEVVGTFSKKAADAILASIAKKIPIEIAYVCVPVEGKKDRKDLVWFAGEMVEA